MFVIPVGSRVNWNRPPVVTLLLIVANCVVFFFFQSGDDRVESEAVRYYFSSDLPGIELPRYADYLKKTGESEKAAAFTSAAGQDEMAMYALALMEHDKKFMQELHGGHIVAPEEPAYADWSKQRSNYEAWKNRSFTERYMFHVDDPNPVNAFTSAFLHGGVDHLLGNMAVLFLVGFLVEAVVGKALFLLAYLVSIFAAVYTYLLVQADAGGGLVGASGAIAGVMGLYTVVFGLRKIDFFYSLLFYFDYIQGPAIALLPVWLGNELYQFVTDGGSDVAFMAHFGGLLCGAAMGGIYRWWRPDVIESGHEPAERQEMDRRLYQKGLDLLGAMEFQRALEVFKALQQQHPGDPDLARQVYNAAKFDPSGEDFHRAARHLMMLPGANAAGTGQLHALYREYLAVAKPAPTLGPDLAARLAKSFAASGHCEDAEKLVSHLMRQFPEYGELPDLLLALARGHHREGRKEKYRAALQLLIGRFPHSQAAVVAGQLLQAASA